MDNILEILVPVIIAAIYFFGNIFGKSSEDDDASPGQPKRRSSEDEGAAERQRNIQEEIRRKIMERRRASGSGERPAPAPSSLQRSEPQKQMREVVPDRQDEPPPLMPAQREAAKQSESSTFTWDKSDDAYGGQIEAKLKRIEATKRQAERLKKEASYQIGKAEPQKSQTETGGYFKGTVRESLQNPRAARAAFIYGEVLGRPISLKKGSSDVPGLN